MKLTFLKLVNYRNYSQLEVSFHPNLNIVYGMNGSGKTNLVEGIYVLGLTRSFRIVGDKTLIKDGESVSKIEGIFDDSYKTNYRIIINNDGKKVKINNKKVAKLSDYISKIPIVLFHPDDLRFIKDTPSTRRKTLNISISELDIEYIRYLNNYNKILKQRNAYLKQMLINNTKDSSYLDILTLKLVNYGLYLYEKRREFISNINNYIGSFYEKISGKKGVLIEYISDYDGLNQEELINIYKKSLAKDLSFGKTNLGIHTDDLRFVINDKDFKDYGSEGQQKNVVIAYKFSELEIFKNIKGSYPILILDDLFSELDSEKKDNILKLLDDNIQTFITTTDLNLFPSIDQYSYKEFLIKDGMILKEGTHERGK